MLHVPRSAEQFTRAKKVIAGGVNSPVRSFASVGGEPLFIKQGKGAYLTDIDGNNYLDYVGSYGAIILGHAHPAVVACVERAATDGLSFGAPTAGESKLAELIVNAMPAVEMLRFVSSGTEACMSALRLARGYTGRSKIVKFSGCYHGHADMLLAKAGSGAATHGISTSLGVPPALVQDTLTVPFNNLQLLRELFAEKGEEIAGVIVEPVIGNCSLITPLPDFLSNLRALCTEHGALLLFDEVMTGFRVGWGGVQTQENITPDLTMLGKVIGGGLPLSAFGGRKDIMAMLAPTGEVYQAGTMSGNPLAVACGIATLNVLRQEKDYSILANNTQKLTAGITQLAKKYSLPMTVKARGGMFGMFFSPTPIESYEQAMESNTGLFKNFFWAMLEQGIYLAPSPYEAGFVSFAHQQQEIETTLAKCEKSMQAMRNQ